MGTTAASCTARLRQLERYLAQDPSNPRLLAQVCDAALAAGEHGAAMRVIETAERQELEPRGWLHRRAHLAMARREWDAALAALALLLDARADEAALLHDVALVYLCAGRHQECRDAVAPLLARPGVEAALLGRLQSLWLRALHHLGALSEAWVWIAQQQEAGRLLRPGAGVASLIAIDLDRFAAAGALSDQALLDPEPVAEAFVAGAYVALARRQTEVAARLLERALEGNPRDGRTWSAVGLTSLQSGDVAAARRQFEQAIRTMPAHIGTWHALGWACLLLQDRPGARGAFVRALELDRNFGESHGALALVLLLEGRDALAEHHLRVAERLDPRSVTAGYVRALRAGTLADTNAVRALAARLLDRPGFFGGRLSDSLPPPAC